MKAETKLRACLNKNKLKPISLTKDEKQTMILCPIKESNVYKETCINKCWYYQKKKCPRKGEK